MRLLVILLAVSLVPPFVAWQKHHYDTDLRSDVQAAVERALNAPGFHAVQARLDHLDVTLSGTVADFALRNQAAARVDALPGARVRTVDNRIRVTPTLTYQRDQGPGEIHGRLHSNDRMALRTLVDRLPIPEAPALHVQGHPSIQPLQPRQRRLVLASLAEFMPLSGPRALSIDGEQVELRGAVTLELLAQLWEQAGPGSDLEQLLYRVPLYPSVYHLPGHRLESSLDSETLARIRELLAVNQPLFAADSAMLDAQQQPRLQGLAEAIRLAAGRARFVVGGHVDAGGTEGLMAGIELGRQRATAVQEALVELGLPADLIEVIDFGPTRLAGEPLGPTGRSVEILLK